MIIICAPECGEVGDAVACGGRFKVQNEALRWNKGMGKLYFSKFLQFEVVSIKL